MRSKNPKLRHVVEQVISQIVQSDFALSSPCLYCGNAFRSRRARLKSCVGVLNGHYTLKQLGRKPAPALGPDNGNNCPGKTFGSHQRAGPDKVPDLAIGPGLTVF